MAKHVDEDVERDVSVLGRALHVVAGVLLAGERVELAPDRVDLTGELPGGRPTLGALEEHVLREMGDAVRLASLVARAGRQHDEAGNRLGLRHRRRDDTQAVAQTDLIEDGHRKPNLTQGREAYSAASASSVRSTSSDVL